VTFKRKAKQMQVHFGNELISRNICVAQNNWHSYQWCGCCNI